MASVAAAQYLRMSTEHQQYSLVNQATTIQRYAEAHGFSVVQTYRVGREQSPRSQESGICGLLPSGAATRKGDEPVTRFVEEPRLLHPDRVLWIDRGIGPQY